MSGNYADLAFNQIEALALSSSRLGISMMSQQASDHSMSGNYRQSETNFHGSNAGMETSAPLFNAIANNALFHSKSRIKQMPPQISHILRFFWYSCCPRFCNEGN